MSPFIPNYPDVAHTDQAEPDSVDFEILLGAYNGTGVASGCEVTAAPTGNLVVAVALGHVLINSQRYAVTAGNVDLSSLPDADYNRFALITVGTNGIPTYAAGPISNNPRFPSIPSNSAVLAAVYLPAAGTDILQTQIVDKRIFVHPAVPKVSALPTADVNYRGKFLRVEGGSGVADVLYQCIKNTSDTYEWIEVGEGGGGGLTENRWRVGGGILGSSPGNGDISTATVEGFVTTGSNYDPEGLLAGGSNNERITIQVSGTYQITIRPSVIIDDTGVEMVNGNILRLLVYLWRNDGSDSIVDTLVFTCPYLDTNNLYYFPPLVTSLILSEDDYLYVQAGLVSTASGSSIETEIAIDEWSGHQIAGVPLL